MENAIIRAGESMGTRKRTLENQRIKVRLPKLSVPRKIARYTLAGLVAIAGIGITDALIKERIEGNRLEVATREAALKYANFDENPYDISDREVSGLRKLVVMANGATFRQDGTPAYSNGKVVPTAVLTQWMKDYRPASAEK